LHLQERVVAVLAFAPADHAGQREDRFPGQHIAVSYHHDRLEYQNTGIFDP
jgi:hypothetical protein